MGTLTRVARTAAATLEHVFEVGEDPVDPTGTPTCVVTDATGAEIASGDATVAGGDSGRVTFQLPPQQQLAWLTVTWTATVNGVAVVEVDQAEIVGGFLFTLAQGRGSDSSLADSDKYTPAQLRAKRTEVEQECEWICDRAFVPRYRRVVLGGTGSPHIVIPDCADEVIGGVLLRGVRTFRSGQQRTRPGLPYTPLSAAELAALAVDDDGVVTRTDGRVWTEGRDNVVLEYEYGADGPPEDLRDAALYRFRDRAQLRNKQVPDRAVSFTITDLGTYRLSLPDAYRTGIPDVDAPYGRYSRRVRGTAPGGAAPASRTLEYDPQFYSLFHGGRR